MTAATIRTRRPQKGKRPMERSYQSTLTVAVLLALTAFALAETKKEYRFNVGAKATVSIINQYGAVTVRPSTGNYVLVNATTYSDKVEVDQVQSGNRHRLCNPTSSMARLRKIPAWITKY